MIVVVAEKPSVARDIARVLGAHQRAEGYLHGAGYAVTWAIGHLVALCAPEQMHARWKFWRFDALPMLPERWPLAVVESTRKQFAAVERLLKMRETREVVCATDAGREGELIFRYIAEQLDLAKPVKRLWISSLTEEAIRAGFARLRPSADFDALADAARGRSRADWLVGMNLSRAYTLAARDAADDARPATAGSRKVFSVGRVQTPTLALIVERDRTIAEFVPEPYLEVAIEVASEAPEQPKFEARYLRSHDDSEPARLPADRIEAEAIQARARTGRARVHAVQREVKRARPPLLYDLTELQRHAHRLYGFSASRTLELSQKLYEQHKLISYPRTDSRHLTTEAARELGPILAAVAPAYASLLEPGSSERPLGRRFVDDASVRDHHAIIPTGRPNRLAAASDEAKLYDLIARRLLAAYQSDYRWAVTTVRLEITSEEASSGPIVDRYFASGTTVLDLGHRRLDVKTRRDAQSEPMLPALTRGQTVSVLDARIDEKRTRPPPHFTEATLLTAMESAGRTLDDRELSDAMRERGLGTPATRAAIIETLVARGFLVREDKTLRSTPAGRELIARVHPHVKSAAMTGEWEHKLRAIERGRGELSSFMREIEAYVREVIESMRPGDLRALREGPPSPVAEPSREDSTADAVALPRARAKPATPPRQPAQPLEVVLRERFGLSEFRPHQREVCEALARGDDALLVMPTGAGKSLCYQLPALARGGTALVVSPLIALIEDQVAKLSALGIACERIHSGLDRELAREACRRYLRGDLSFLFIAPERLRVPGFADMLARRPPTLIAIDEAHCISHWGHDFRPDYRMLHDRLPRSEHTPVIALTATATKAVQDDIVEQLAMPKALRSIRGFRRENLAIHMVEAAPPLRSGLARELLGRAGRLPAIVYAPTRKRAEEVAHELARQFRSAAYHAGLDPGTRERVQGEFLAGRLDVIVATIAFGMGIDKADVRTVVHLAMPASLEGYYQEIGRAGRDGSPAIALLLASSADRRMHEFFFERDYPAPAELDRVYAALSSVPVDREALAQRLRLDDDALNAALDKLWIHGGARFDEGRIVRGEEQYRRSYPLHRAHRAAQLGEVARFMYAPDCRMCQLVRHFGDRADAKTRCGRCDRCGAERPLFGASVLLGRPSNSAPRPARRSSRPASAAEDVPAPARLVEALQSFRRREADRRAVPPFRIFSDRTLYALASERPESEAALRAVPGVSATVARKYGKQLLTILRGD